MNKGCLAVILHAHLPYVRHIESELVLEERWVFEAMTETYIPLLQVFEQLVKDGADFRVTMTLTPPLLAMFEDPLVQHRYRTHISQLCQLAGREIKRTAGEPEFHTVARHYAERFSSVRTYYDECAGDLVSRFRALQDKGVLEVITCAATHAFLPYVQTTEAIRAQVATAVRDYERHFHRAPRGIWLPECGFAPGVDEILAEYGLSYFVVGEDAFSQASPCPVRGTLAPVVLNSGVAAFARDLESSKQVWSSIEGYPGDPDYREYYRDIGYELDEEDAELYLHPSGVRHDTGIKYYRITGKTDDKAVYNPTLAREKAALHAGNFFDARIRQLTAAAQDTDSAPIVVAPYDAELFGHWWYEGPEWLDLLFRKLHYDQDDIRLVTPSEYLGECTELQVSNLGMSSWGAGGFGEVWLNDTNDWIYPALHACEDRMVKLAGAFSEPSALEQRVLNQAARELLLAQSSDFAFIMDHQTVTEYAAKRTKAHINRFLALCDSLESGAPDEVLLRDTEYVDNLFPLVEYRDYRAAQHSVPATPESSSRPAVLMLSWEFPPMTVGGLSRHVWDLSRYLARADWDVHVLTVRIGDTPAEEQLEGVHVHRVDVPQPDGGEFRHWAFSLNLAMVQRCETLLQDVRIDLVHAHDWMVCYAAKRLKHDHNLPLVATIHATEHGRNHGIHTPLQEYIHHQEWELTYEAARVILCSTYMKNEVETIFSLPEDKLRVIPNGVDPAQLATPGGVSATRGYRQTGGPPIVVYIGRLVREKGVQVLVEAAPEILSRCPGTRFVILGTGPHSGELKQLANEHGVAGQFEFRGFVSDEERNQLLQTCDTAVFPSLYEPFGIVALEAMAAGAPVVVSDVGGLADVVQHGENGRKVYPGDIHSLATQVSDAIKQPEASIRMAARATAELGRYDWMLIAKESAGVYLDASHSSEVDVCAKL